MEQQNPRGAPVCRSVPGANIVLEPEKKDKRRANSYSVCLTANIDGIDASTPKTKSPCVHLSFVGQESVFQSKKQHISLTTSADVSWVVLFLQVLNASNSFSCKFL